MHGVSNTCSEYIMPYLSDMDEVSGDLGSRNMPGMSKTPGVSGMPVVLPSCAGSGNGWVLVRWGRGASDHIAFLGPPYTVHPLPHPALF
jgi:hypothetical protein